jgi:hypothetical protein
MPQKLTFNTIAATLAAIGATTLVACGGAAPPAQSPVTSQEVPAAAAAAPAAPAAPATTSAASDPSPAAAPATDSTASTDTAAPSPSADANQATPDASGDKAKPDEKAAAAKKPMAKGKKRRTGGAKSSCGAGTCG